MTGETDGELFELRRDGCAHSEPVSGGTVLATADAARRGRWTISMLPVELTFIGRHEPDCTVAGVGGWSRTGEPVGLHRRFSTGGPNVTALVFETGSGTDVAIAVIG